MTEGRHKHRCDCCGTVFEHGDGCKGNGAAHTCPRCGRPAWLRYDGHLQPEFTDHHLQHDPTDYAI